MRDNATHVPLLGDEIKVAPSTTSSGTSRVCAAGAVKGVTTGLTAGVGAGAILTDVRRTVAVRVLSTGVLVRRGLGTLFDFRLGRLVFFVFFESDFLRLAFELATFVVFSISSSLQQLTCPFQFT